MKREPNWALFLAVVALGFAIGGLTFKENKNMASGYPDWTRAVALIGQDPDGNLILIKVDADGQLTVPFKGVNPSAELVTVAVDADGQLYSIMKGTDGNIMAVDSDGYMTAVLKGDYEGALRTIGLDDEGRISGYLVDAEDQWGQILKVGNAEQAARLGSPVSWDRRGQVQLLHTFADGLEPLGTSAYGSGASVTLDAENFVTGGYSAKLTGGSDGLNRYAGLSLMLGVPPSDRIGVAIRWSAVSAPHYLYMLMQIYRDGDLTAGAIRYDFNNKRLQYADENSVWQNLPVQDFYYSKNVWCSMKMVIDHSVGGYVRALLNGTAYDLDAYAAPTATPGTGDYIAVDVRLYSHEGDNDVAYIDTFTVTSGEPENP